jgi:hypothetical protein
MAIRRPLFEEYLPTDLNQLLQLTIPAGSVLDGTGDSQFWVKDAARTRVARAFVEQEILKRLSEVDAVIGTSVFDAEIHQYEKRLLDVFFLVDLSPDSDRRCFRIGVIQIRNLLGDVNEYRPYLADPRYRVYIRSGKGDYRNVYLLGIPEIGQFTHGRVDYAPIKRLDNSARAAIVSALSLSRTESALEAAVAISEAVASHVKAVVAMTTTAAAEGRLTLGPDREAVWTKSPWYKPWFMPCWYKPWTWEWRTPDFAPVKGTWTISGETPRE